jgi:hypothetical protein
MALHRALLDEHFRVEGRRTWFETVEEMQAGLDTYTRTWKATISAGRIKAEARTAAHPRGPSSKAC